MRIWIDMENPPQVQYLLPFRRAFQACGIGTVVTARDYGSTVQMLEHAGVEAPVFGARVGRGKLRKVASTGTRAWELCRFFGRTGKPSAVLSASRASSLAARWMGIPSFLIVDYEHTHGRAARIADSTVMYPEVISRSALLRRGVRATRLVSFKGLKEDLTFANVDVNAIDPHELGSVPEDAVRVLFRPPSETSHYYRSASTKLAKATLAHLAGEEALVVFSPRERAQARLLDAFDWRHEPRVLERPVPFVSLLKSIDLVVCSGGTMLREAAYLGVPAYSIFQSEIGAVDRWLERLGRAKLIGHQDELHEIDLRRRGPLRRLDSNPELLDQLAGIISAGATERLADRTCVAA